MQIRQGDAGRSDDNADKVVRRGAVLLCVGHPISMRCAETVNKEKKHA